MAIKLHNLKSTRGSRTTVKRVGRGNASGKGTTAGRGQKGQKARTGGRGGHKIRGMRRLVMQTPKLRGFKRQGLEADTVNLRDLQAVFSPNDVVTVRSLKSKGLISASAKRAKVLGLGVLKKGLTVKGCQVSQPAKDKILAAGGDVR